MKTTKVFLKTFIYSILKFGIVLFAMVFSAGLFMLMYFIPVRINEVIGNIGFAIWVILNPVIYYWIKTFFGYSLRGQHLYSSYDATSTGRLPVNMLKEEKQNIDTIFPLRNLYIGCELNLTKIIRQLYEYNYPDQKGIKAKLKDRYLRFAADAAICYLFLDTKGDLVDSIGYASIIYDDDMDEFDEKIGNRPLTVTIVFASLAFLICGAAFVISMILSSYNFIITLFVTILSIFLVLAIKYAFIDPIQFMRLIPLYINKDIPEGHEEKLENIRKKSSALDKLLKKREKQ